MTRQWQGYGAIVKAPGRVDFRLWAPDAREVELLLGEQTLPMTREDNGEFVALDVPASSGAAYRYCIDGGTAIADPASRAQDGDVEAASLVVDPAAYRWRTEAWQGHAREQLIICEVHVGLCGGFDGLRRQLGHYAAAGYTAIELMPVAEFPGERNWGYDGVLPYAPESAYGSPDALRQLVDEAHSLGLSVLLDVVYNHFGPRGNLLSTYAPAFFDDDRSTPWGAAIDFRQPQVRRFFIGNALMWLADYRFDGLRLDAVHAIAPEDFLLELSAEARASCSPRQIHLILENEHNASHLLRGAFDAQWNDDGHNALHVLLTGERHAYYADFATRPIEQLALVLRDGFAFQGQADRRGVSRGEPSGDLPPSAFVLFLQNHDQVGNRPFGERLSTLAAPAALRAAVALVALSPMIPLFFMGDEWGCTTPFLFFCDYTGELAEAVRQGRAAEFSEGPASGAQRDLPDPNARSTFQASVPRVEEADVALSWSEWFAQLLAKRRRQLCPALRGAHAIDCEVIGNAALLARWRLGDGSVWEMALNLGSVPATLPSSDTNTVVHAEPFDAAYPRCRGALPPHSLVVRLLPHAAPWI
ncbi:malto-oligosyltrehalose trehalohydrolase [Bacillus sp. SRB_336]|nr:malto-oligosyltrehalose trehalohydrolase [Bacillus sp. SRB_336]